MLSSGVTLFVILPALVVLLTSVVFSLRKHAWRSAPTSIVQLRWDENDQWFVRNAREEEHAVRLEQNSFRFAWLVVLNFRDERGRRISVVIMRDATDAQSFRRLKARLLVNPRLNYEPAP